MSEGKYLDFFRYAVNMFEVILRTSAWTNHSLAHASRHLPIRTGHETQCVFTAAAENNSALHQSVLLGLHRVCVPRAISCEWFVAQIFKGGWTQVPEARCEREVHLKRREKIHKVRHHSLHAATLSPALEGSLGGFVWRAREASRLRRFGESSNAALAKCCSSSSSYCSSMWIFKSKTNIRKVTCA